LLSALGSLLPFWDRDIDLLVVPQASGEQLNGLSAVLDRYEVKQIMAVEAPNDNQAGRDWQALLAQKNKEPIPLQNAGIDADVSLTFDGSSALVESGGNKIAIGPSEQAPINVIAGKIDRLPENPQMIFTWTPILSDTRVINLADRGTLDFAFGEGDVAIGEIR
jgi:hypothetical protein